MMCRWLPLASLASHTHQCFRTVIWQYCRLCDAISERFNSHLTPACPFFPWDLGRWRWRHDSAEFSWTLDRLFGDHLTWSVEQTRLTLRILVALGVKKNLLCLKDFLPDSHLNFSLVECQSMFHADDKLEKVLGRYLFIFIYLVIYLQKIGWVYPALFLSMFSARIVPHHPLNFLWFP